MLEQFVKATRHTELVSVDMALPEVKKIKFCTQQR